MRKLTRRTFIGNAGVLAAAVTVGVSASEGIKKHGPVELRVGVFMTGGPLVIPGDLFSDEKRQVFRIRAFDRQGAPRLHGEHEAHGGLAELPLATVRRVVGRISSRAKISALFVNEHGEARRIPMVIAVEKGDLTLLLEEKGETPTPVWIRLSDVQRVI